MGDTKNDHTIEFAVTDKTTPVRFLASLSDGRTVVQDDRPTKRHAWARLAEWIKINPEISITEIRLQGPKGVDLKMPPNQKGYFFGHKLCKVWMGPQHNYTGIGYYDGNVVDIAWYRQPKFDHTFTEQKTVAEAGFFLVVNA